MVAAESSAARHLLHGRQEEEDAMIIELDLIEAVREQARRHPERVYLGDSGEIDDCPVSCSYVPNERNPGFGCIVGEALASLGVPTEALERITPLGSWASPTNFLGMHQALGAWVADGALTSVWVARVQSAQDESCPWALAVERADDELSAA